MADLNAALVQQFLDIPVAAKRPHGRCSGQEAQGKAVVQPDGVLDDTPGEAARLAQASPFWPRNGDGRAWRRSRRAK